METGTIVYVADGNALPADFNPEAAVRALGMCAEWAEVASSAPGCYQVPEALLALARRGAGRVDLLSAHAGEGMGLELGRQRLRILG